MPTPKTRQCPVCKHHKPTGVGFRDPGDVTRGRPPRVCHECRAADPALVAQQAANVAFREENRRRHREDYAEREPDEVLAARARLHPGGVKFCPDGSGCGQSLPLSAFGEGAHQAAGLASLCRSCDTD